MCCKHANLLTKIYIAQLKLKLIIVNTNIHYRLRHVIELLTKIFILLVKQLYIFNKATPTMIMQT